MIGEGFTLQTVRLVLATAATTFVYLTVCMYVWVFSTFPASYIIPQA